MCLLCVLNVTPLGIGWASEICGFVSWSFLRNTHSLQILPLLHSPWPLLQKLGSDVRASHSAPRGVLFCTSLSHFLVFLGYVFFIMLSALSSIHSFSLELGLICSSTHSLNNFNSLVVIGAAFDYFVMFWILTHFNLLFHFLWHIKHTYFTVCLIKPIPDSFLSPSVLFLFVPALTHDAWFPVCLTTFFQNSELFIFLAETLGDRGQKRLPPEKMCLLLWDAWHMVGGVLPVWDQVQVSEWLGVPGSLRECALGWQIHGRADGSEPKGWNTTVAFPLSEWGGVSPVHLLHKV